MKKVINKKRISKPKLIAIIEDETTSTQKVKESIDKLSITFGSEDLNKVVDKINEIIEKQ